MTTRISIIIVNWNGKRWLDQCLTSISNQEISEEFEIILVDNGSLDGSVEYVHDNFPQINVIALNKNYGYAEGNNIGLTKAKGEYLIFINTDTRVEPNWLKTIVNAADENPRYKILCSIQLPLMRAAIPAMGHFFGPFFGVFYSKTSEDVIESNFASGGCFLLRRSWLSEVGYLFDPSYFSFSEDTDLSLRTIIAGGKIGYVKRSVMWHFIGGSHYNSSWAGRINMINQLRTFQKLFSTGIYRRFLLAIGFSTLIYLIKEPICIKTNIARLTGFVEFIIFRRSFLKKDRMFHLTSILDENKFLQEIRHDRKIGKLMKWCFLGNIS